MIKSVKTYVLLGLVLLIWGIIGFKVVNALSNKPNVPDIQPTQPRLTNIVQQRDTFSIIADYRDPFLGTLYNTKKKDKKTGIKKKLGSKKNILFMGLVSQTGSRNSMFFVSIDGQQHIMSINEEINGVTLLKGDNKKIMVRYDGRSETILLQ